MPVNVSTDDRRRVVFRLSFGGLVPAYQSDPIYTSSSSPDRPGRLLFPLTHRSSLCGTGWRITGTRNVSDVGRSDDRPNVLFSDIFGTGYVV